MRKRKIDRYMHKHKQQSIILLIWMLSGGFKSIDMRVDAFSHSPHVGMFSSFSSYLKAFQNDDEDFKRQPNYLSCMIVHSKLGGKEHEEARPRVCIQDVLRNLIRKRQRRYQRTLLLSSPMRRRRHRDRVSSSLNVRLHRIPRGGALKNHVQLYCRCLFVVLVWIATGTLFYSKYNGWPLPQSFFYAVDAGMSIGFCTDVAEIKVGSRAFTIVYILLGASCVGGALALFIKDIMEGIVNLKNDTFEYLLAEHAAKRYAVDGSLTYEDFRNLLQEWMNRKITDETFQKLCQRFDPSGKGSIKSAIFVEKCLELEKFLNASRGPLLHSNYLILRKIARIGEVVRDLFDGTRRIFTVFVAWLFTGICKSSKWIVDNVI